MKYDRALNSSRVFFILSCVMAHCLLSHSEMTNNFANKILTLLSFLSCIGVPCFLITSGILFKKLPLKKFLMKKITNICIPWIFCGTIIFLISYFSAYSLLEHVKFVFGIGSFLYYIPVLLFCYLIFYILPNKKLFYTLCIALNYCSLVATQFGLINFPNNSLNFLNWIGYFAIGRWIASSTILNIIRSHSICIFSVCTIFSFLSCIVACMYQIESYYYGILLIVAPCWFFTIYLLCTIFFENNKLFQEIGKTTYTIYLVHMPFAALFKKIVRIYFPQTQIYILLPLAVILISFVAIKTYMSCILKNKILYNLSKKLLGLR
ncbi:Acyltransferase family protein [Clostridiales bacterium CHKCI006]|nr:Acyltransferase family protein [Clostridiales bacterium CHKCI006]